MKIPEHIKKLLKEAVNQEVGVKFDLACGDLKQQGCIGIDIIPNQYVDIVGDLEETPYKGIPSECASLLIVSHYVEHIKPWLLIDVMNEWWRILKVGGQMMVSTPYAGSPQFWQDPTHIKGWNEATPEYFDPFGPMTKGSLYHVYHSAPWKVIKNTWDITGTLEVLFEKRPDDPSYHEVKLLTR